MQIPSGKTVSVNECRRPDVKQQWWQCAELESNSPFKDNHNMALPKNTGLALQISIFKKQMNKQPGNLFVGETSI